MSVTNVLSDKKTFELVANELSKIEAKHGVKILYACESGSRAWGFASQNSDYDVRFIYVQPVEKYLSIISHRDVIEIPITGDLDINGWDLRKALQLFRKSNPPLMEWLVSPLIYLEQYSLADKLRQLTAHSYSRSAMSYHYLHMAQGNYREYLRGERVQTKKYFYVLRPLLAVKWIEQDRGIVPTEFNSLVEKLSLTDELKAEIAKLLIAKKAGKELDDGPRNDIFNGFIESELTRLEAHPFTYESAPDPLNELDEIFRETLKEVWP